MKYKDWIRNKEGLFKVINEKSELMFLKSYGVENAERVFKFMFGNKEVASNACGLSVNEIADMLVATYSEKWTKLFNEFTEMKLNVSHETVQKIVYSDDENRQMSSMKDDSVSAFNDDDFVKDNSTQDKSNDDIMKSGNKEIVTTVKDYDIFSPQVKTLSSNFLVSVVCHDIKDFLLLKTY